MENKIITMESKTIRFITSSYTTLFELPDGEFVQITTPERTYSQQCSYIGTYHFRLGFFTFHICQFAEIMEKNGCTYIPEPDVCEKEMAWSIGCSHILAIQASENGYDYSIYSADFHLIDGGCIDDPNITIKEARNQILSDRGLNASTLEKIPYEDVMDAVSNR